jgi:hypothetical protein
MSFYGHGYDHVTNYSNGRFIWPIPSLSMGETATEKVFNNNYK